MIFDDSTLSANEINNFPDKGSIGIGFGIPYGILGVNGDITIKKKLNLSVGLGQYYENNTSAYNIGLKYFIRDNEKIWRPRVSILYGSNAFLNFTYPDGSAKTVSYSGFNLGIGQQWNFGKTRKHGIDLDILYMLSDGGYDDDWNDFAANPENIIYKEKSNNKIKFSFGYRHNF